VVTASTSPGQEQDLDANPNVQRSADLSPWNWI